jgi:hypothetical protein
MKLLKPDHHRTIEIPGVPEPVRRPVDIDKAKTGFTTLRSLRIYRFDAGAVIEGHAEEDEVLIVVLNGAIELTLIEHNEAKSSQTATLSAPTETVRRPCAAYLPPEAAYRLKAQTDADVAYTRATPATGPKPAFFTPKTEANHVLWEEVSYPKLLCIRLLHIDATQDEVTLSPIAEAESNKEALLYLTTKPEEGSATITDSNQDSQPLTSWDTVALAPGASPTLHIAKGTSAQLLLIQAACG